MKLKLFATCCLLLEGYSYVHAVPDKPSPSSAKQLQRVEKAAKPLPTAASDSKSAAKAAQTGQNANGTAPPAQHRARLDVGFASFKKSMMDRILLSIRNATESSHWDSKLQLACKDNVSQALSQGLKAQLAALKQSIGKTWMSLPEDEQKDAYVSQLRASYEPVFSDTVATIDSHLQRSLKHLQIHSAHQKPLSQDVLLARCSSAIVGNILEERCYDLGGEQHLKKVNSFLEIKGNAPRKFCMPSVFEAMARRLHDSQGLIGMTMQFESKSMSLQAAPTAVNDIVQAATAASH